MTEEKSSPKRESPQKPVNYITEDILEQICHTLAVRLFAKEEPMGLYKDHDGARLKSSLALPQASHFGHEAYPGLYRKAAVLFYVLNRNHAFGNGNKRLSVAAVIVFLFINDIIFTGTEEDIRDKALWIAQTPESIGIVTPRLADWLQQHSISRREYERKIGV